MRESVQFPTSSLQEGSDALSPRRGECPEGGKRALRLTASPGSWIGLRSKAPSLKDRLARMLFYTTLSISPVEIPFPRLDPAPPPAAVLPVGDPTPGIGAWRG